MNKRLVVIVEDNLILGEIFAETIQEIGYETELINDGLNAFDTITEAKPALVILDLHLPHVSGVEILGDIRMSEELAHTKVVVITADVQRGGEVKTQADMVLFKPVGLEQMQNAINQMLNE